MEEYRTMPDRKRKLSPEAQEAPNKRVKTADGTNKQGLPGCRGFPPVWAEMRQSLNSALPWHKGYQSGDYTKDLVLLGCLLDGFPEERDVIDPSGVIIMNM